MKYFTTEESPSYKTIRVSQQLWLATSLDDGNTENRVGNCFPLLGKLWEFNIVHKFILGAAQGNKFFTLDYAIYFLFY